MFFAPFLVAADGGADSAEGLGHRPDLVVGDFDSLSDTLRRAMDPSQLVKVETQDTTDFDKALAAIRAPFVLAVGFSGARLDHTLAAMNSLVRNPQQRVIVDTGHDLCVVLPPEVTLALPAGTRVSLFPMGRVKCTSTGLEWPIDGLKFAPTGKIGTSNRAVGGPVHLTSDAPRMLLLLPQTELAGVLTALAAAPLWPGDARARQ